MTDLERAAWSLIGNWKGMHEFDDCPLDVESPDDWCIVWMVQIIGMETPNEVTEAIEAASKECVDIKAVQRPHWAWGTLHGAAIRVFRDGRITEAFEKFFTPKKESE